MCTEIDDGVSNCARRAKNAAAIRGGKRRRHSRRQRPCVGVITSPGPDGVPEAASKQDVIMVADVFDMSAQDGPSCLC